MSSPTRDPLLFYDIVSPLRPRSYAPNPSKARLALSLKAVPFTTRWIDILDIPETRKSLNCPATRKLDDGSDFFTLPMLQDPSTGTVLGDTVDIANYLEDTYPESGGALFPQREEGKKAKWMNYESPFADTMFFAPLTCFKDPKNPEYARFNVHVDATFSANMVLFGYFMPFNPETAEDVKKLMCKRAHLNSWEDIKIVGEARGPLMGQFKEALKGLAECFDGEGPFLEGERVCYADCILGGWLNMLNATMPKEEWAEFVGWYGGMFGRLHGVLQEKYWKCE